MKNIKNLLNKKVVARQVNLGGENFHICPNCNQEVLANQKICDCYQRIAKR